MMCCVTHRQTPFIMVMMKVDLLSKEARKKLYRYIDPDSLEEMMDEVEENSANKGRIHLFKKWISVVSGIGCRAKYGLLIPLLCKLQFTIDLTFNDVGFILN